MKKIGLVLATIILILGLGFGQSMAQSGWAQISLQNNTSVTLDLYIDSDYGCRALSGMFCTAQISVGNHTLTVKASDGRSLTQGPFYFEQGVSPTWTVGE